METRCKPLVKTIHEVLCWDWVLVVASTQVAGLWHVVNFMTHLLPPPNLAWRQDFRKSRNMVWTMCGVTDFAGKQQWIFIPEETIPRHFWCKGTLFSISYVSMNVMPPPCNTTISLRKNIPPPLKVVTLVRFFHRQKLATWNMDGGHEEKLLFSCFAA